MKHLIILNPVSGKGQGERAEPEIHRTLKLQGIVYECVKTERPWHAAELAEASVGSYDVVVAAGGDGTANEVLNGLMATLGQGKALPALGVLGVGRGNDFAFGIGVPHDVRRGGEILRQNRRFRIDVGRVWLEEESRARFFGNGVGIGFDACVGFEAAKFKRLSGFPAYAVAAMKTMFRYHHAPLLRVTWHDASFEMPALMLSIMNGRRMGGGFYMAPHGEPDDGLFDLCLVSQIPLPAFPALIARFMKGTQSKHRAVRTARTNALTVRAVEGSIPAHADGETLCGAGETLSVEIVPLAIEVVGDPETMRTPILRRK